MRAKLNWVDVLNEQTHWHDRNDLKQWIFDLAGRQLSLLDGTIEGFEEALGFMRRSVASLQFGEPVDLLWLDTQLKTISLGLLHHQGAQEGDGSRLPLFRARVKGMHDTDLLRAVKDTLLVQFAEYVGDALDAPQHANVLRCEGLHTHASGVPVSAAARYPEEIERQWMEQISAVLTKEDDAEVERCSYFFIGQPKSKFCSDACRFATMQLTNKVEEPEYLPTNKRRRRNKA